MRFSLSRLRTTEEMDPDMRRYSFTITAIAAVLLSSTALAQPAGGGEDEVEIDEPATPAEGAEGEGEPEIEIEPEEAQGDLAADSAALAETDAQAEQALKTEGPLGDYRVSWQDIVVVIRKPFLKVSRWELQ